MDEPEDANGAVLDAIRVIGRRSTPELVRAYLPGLELFEVEARMEALVASGHLRHSNATVRRDESGVDRIFWASYDLVD